MKALESDVRVSLAVLRRHINSLESPLYHLPPELFPEIVSHLSSETDLVNATRVSYRLRDTLLSYPSLWSYLNFEHKRRARAFLVRSGQTPLHVNMAWDNSHTARSLAKLRQQSNRIVTLKLPDWSVQKNFLSTSLPSLRRLEIIYDCYDGDWKRGWDTLWAPVWGPIEEATSWSFPVLTSLIVYELSPIPFYTTYLTRFKFRAERTRRPLNVDELLGFLDSCPLLEHIDILYVGELPRDKPDLVVSLPCLRTYMQTTPGGVGSPTVLNALSLPPFCSITFRSQDGGATTAETDDILPHFENPDYSAEIKRIKLRTTEDIDENEVLGALEFINAKGTKVCSERAIDFEEEDQSVMPGSKDVLDTAHLNFLRNIDGRSVEVLCISGCTFCNYAEVAAKFLVGALGFGNVRTLILSRSAAWTCLSALDEDPGASGHSQWFFLIHTLIIHSKTEYSKYHPGEGVLLPLLGFARKRKTAGFPLRLVSLFICDGMKRRWFRTLGKLRTRVGELEVTIGDDVLDWDVDRYFLDGLDHLQKDYDVQWD